MKKGFTLIELLAVILILGVIALIAIPTVTSIIEETKNNAFEVEVDNFVKSIDNYIVTKDLQGSVIEDGVYQSKDFLNKINFKNAFELNGWIQVENGKVNNYSFSNDKILVTSEDDNKEILEINSIEESRMNNTFPYKNSYSDKIVNAYITYGTVPKNSIESWSMSNDGKINGYVVKNNENNELYDLYIVSKNKIIAPASMSSMFYNFSEIKTITFDNFDTRETTSITNAFRGCKNLEKVNVDKFNTSKMTQMQDTFCEDESLKELNISTWDTRNVINMTGLFSRTTNLKTIDIRNFDTSKVKMFSWMFSYTTNLQEIKGIEKINTSNADSFAYMFCSSGISNLKINFDTSNATSTQNMFAYMNKAKELDLSSFDTTKITNMDGMFRDQTNLEKIIVGSKWDTSSVTTSANMFLNDKKLKGAVSFDASKIDVSMANTTTGYLTLK